MCGVGLGLARVVPSLVSWFAISFPIMPMCAWTFWIVILWEDHWSVSKHYWKCFSLHLYLCNSLCLPHTVSWNKDRWHKITQIIYTPSEQKYTANLQENLLSMTTSSIDNLQLHLNQEDAMGMGPNLPYTIYHRKSWNIGTYLDFASQNHHPITKDLMR